MHAYVLTYTHTYIHAYIHNTHISVCIYTYVNMYTYKHIYIHTYMHAYIHIHTYTYIHTLQCNGTPALSPTPTCTQYHCYANYLTPSRYKPFNPRHPLTNRTHTTTTTAHRTACFRTTAITRTQLISLSFHQRAQLQCTVTMTSFICKVNWYQMAIIYA